MFAKNYFYHGYWAPRYFTGTFSEFIGTPVGRLMLLWYILMSETEL